MLSHTPPSWFNSDNTLLTQRERSGITTYRRPRLRRLLIPGIFFGQSRQKFCFCAWGGIKWSTSYFLDDPRWLIVILPDKRDRQDIYKNKWNWILTCQELLVSTKIGTACSCFCLMHMALYGESPREVHAICMQGIIRRDDRLTCIQGIFGAMTAFDAPMVYTARRPSMIQVYTARRPFCIVSLVPEITSAARDKAAHKAISIVNHNASERVMENPTCRDFILPVPGGANKWMPHDRRHPTTKTTTINNTTNEREDGRALTRHRPHRHQKSTPALGNPLILLIVSTAAHPPPFGNPLKYAAAAEYVAKLRYARISPPPPPLLPSSLSETNTRQASYEEGRADYDKNKIRTTTYVHKDVPTQKANQPTKNKANTPRCIERPNMITAAVSAATTPSRIENPKGSAACIYWYQRQNTSLRSSSFSPFRCLLHENNMLPQCPPLPPISTLPQKQQLMPRTPTQKIP